MNFNLLKKNYLKIIYVQLEKKTAVYIGRFQPFHNGHKTLFLNALKKNGQVAILVMDSFNVNKKNPFTFNEVKKNKKALIEYQDKYIIIKNTSGFRVYIWS